MAKWQLRQSRVTCCKDCKERNIGCHGACERYLAQKELHKEAVKAERRSDFSRFNGRVWADYLRKKQRDKR